MEFWLPHNSSWSPILFKIYFESKKKKADTDLLINVCYSVHPAANADLVANIWRVAELMNDTDMIWVRATKNLLF